LSVRLDLRIGTGGGVGSFLFSAERLCISCMVSDVMKNLSDVEYCDSDFGGAVGKVLLFVEFSVGSGGSCLACVLMCGFRGATVVGG